MNIEVEFPTGKTTMVSLAPSSYGEEGKYFESSDGPFFDELFWRANQDQFIGTQWAISHEDGVWLAYLLVDE